MILYLTLASCAFLAGWLVYRYDMYEREPWYMVVFAIGLGFVAMHGIGYVEEFTLRLLNDPVAVFNRAMVAATHEEAIRLILVIGLAIFIPTEFNDPMDGIIYGCLIGLGMAINESIFYLNLWGNPEFMPPNEIFRLLGHLIMGGITGFGVGMMRMKMTRWLPATIGCVTFSVTLHCFWDIIAFISGERGESSFWLKTASVVVVFGGMFFFGFLVVLASEWSRLIFAPDEKARLWGWPFTLLFAKDQEVDPD